MLLVYLGGSIILWSILTCYCQPSTPHTLSSYEIAMEQEQDPYSIL